MNKSAGRLDQGTAISNFHYVMPYANQLLR
jgi:hypothetical protein